MRTRLILALVLALAACGRAPASHDAVAVVAGPSAPPDRVQRPPATMPPAALTAEQPKLLTVAQSAQINTSDMWSEPLKATD